MDAEQLRAIYNERFSQQRNIWSSVDERKTMKVARSMVRWLKGFGFNKPAARLLDVGCATGFYTEAFRRLGYDVVGLDYSEVAIEKATRNFPHCQFIQINGFEPTFHQEFDVIFCSGFSGANTHDLPFIAKWINRYMAFISPGGFFIFSYLSNFSGKEQEGEIVNHSMKEINDLVRLIEGEYRGIHLFQYFGLVSRIKKFVQRRVLGKNVREYYSVFIQKPVS